MNRISEAAEFMRYLGQDEASVDSVRALEVLDGEIGRGLEGKPGGLLMIPSLTLPGDGISAGDTECTAVDIGGTTLKSAKVRSAPDGRIELSDIRKGTVPGLESSVTEREFFERVCSFAGIDSSTGNAALSFSHYMKPLDGLDGQILEWCKEISVTDRSGGTIAGIMRDAAGNDELNVRVVNDSVASMLGNIDRFEKGDILLGIIVGTGFNICWTDDSGVCYNTEIGDSKAFPQGLIDSEIDISSDRPGTAVCEKMVSGVYLEKIIDACMETALSSGYLSKADRYRNLSLESLCSVIDNEHDTTEEFISGIVRQTLTRSAKIAALCCSALIRRNAPESRRVYIGLEGSVINRAYGYRDAFSNFLDAGGRDVRLVTADFSGIKGAARLMSI